MKPALAQVAAATMVLMAAWPFAGCSKVLQPDNDEVQNVMEAVLYAEHQMTPEEGEAAEHTDDGRRAAYKKMFIDPLRNQGYDVDRSLQLFAHDMLADQTPPEERATIKSFLPFYVKWADDLARFGLIKPETAELLKQVRL